MSGMDMPAAVKDRYLALVRVIERTGALTYRVEHTDPANKPVVWVAVAEHGSAAKGARRTVSVGGGTTPLHATYELASRLIDGGTCAHCGRGAALEDLGAPVDAVLGGVADLATGMAFDVCWYRFDPELKKYRRSCEGDT